MTMHHTDEIGRMTDAEFMKDGERSGDETTLQDVEDVREEWAERCRTMLDLPPAPKILDPEVDTVLAYITYCSDYYIMDSNLSKSGEYNVAVGCHDLGLLRTAIDRVERMFKVAGAKARKAKKATVADIVEARRKTGSMTEACALAKSGVKIVDTQAKTYVMTDADWAAAEEADPDLVAALAAGMKALAEKEKKQDGKKAVAMTIKRKEG